MALLAYYAHGWDRPRPIFRCRCWYQLRSASRVRRLHHHRLHDLVGSRRPKPGCRLAWAPFLGCFSTLVVLNQFYKLRSTLSRRRRRCCSSSPGSAVAWSDGTHIMNTPPRLSRLRNLTSSTTSSHSPRVGCFLAMSPRSAVYPRLLRPSSKSGSTDPFGLSMTLNLYRIDAPSARNVFSSSP